MQIKYFMKKNYIIKIVNVVMIMVFTLSSYAQNRQNLWTKISKESVSSTNLVERNSTPKNSGYYRLDIQNLKVQLLNAPDRNLSGEPSNLIIDFPTADGKLEPYRIKEASILAPELQRQVPNIRSYIGESIDNPGTVIRFSVTPQGLHTMTLSSKIGTQYIEPYTKDTNAYVVFARRDLSFEDRNFVCEFDDEGLRAETPEIDESAFRNANDGKTRTFRLALACTVEYAQFHWQAAGLTNVTPVAERKDAVLAAMVVTMTRVNALYERELSVNMTIIPNNLDIIYILTDPYTNNNGGAMLDENQANLTNVIGGANYDIGHVFSTGGGGVAILNSPCTTTNKAKGVTGLPQPVGDIFDYEYVAHEMGHQYGSPHTWNADINSGSCPLSQRSGTDAYEPGSGTTIMGYAGLCGSQNVQPFTDIYFHQRSLQRIWFNLVSGNSQCADQTDSGNSAPVADAGANYTIPRLTPYKLTGSATDTDGIESLTYTWEQYDLGLAGVPTESTATGPLVRSFEGTENPTRYVPNLEDLMDSNGSTTWEKLPGVARNLNFQVTVRDNDPRGGQTDSDQMTISVSAAAGPFLVTSQNTSNISWTQGDTETITWDVAGTTGLGVNTANVNILLSTDGGQTFDTVLASNVANDGSHDITVPNIIEPFCRIMVEAVGNIFFNINTETFAIGTIVTEICNVYESGNVALDIPDGLGTTSPIQGTPVFSNITVTEDVIIEGNIKFNVDITHSFLGDFIIQIQHPEVATNNAFVNVYVGNCGNNVDLDITFVDGAPAIVCASPTIGEYAPANPLTVFDGLSSAGVWRVAVVDFFQGDTGVLNDWSIEICTTSLSTEDFASFDDLSIYPNPNNGQFTVKLKSASNKDINVEVFDIRGRSVLKESYRNTGDFNQNINLNNAQSGMYLLNIDDGERKITKKIIIN